MLAAMAPHDVGAPFQLGSEDLHGRLERRIATGALFEVYQAVLSDGRAVAIKIPAAQVDRGRTPMFGAYAEIIFSRLHSVQGHVHRATLANPCDTTIQARLLAAEATRITASHPWWNHDVVYSGPAQLSRDKVVPALVTPWHNGHAFGALDRGTQREIFPKMIPALWRALAAAPHGDVHPGQFIVTAALDRFVLIDPGVELFVDERHATGDGHSELSFLTNHEHYPVVPPYYASTFAAAHRRRHFRSFIGTSSGFEVPIGPHASAVGPVIPAVHDGSAPRVADLLALGVVYYRVLTGQHPFYDGQYRYPAWYDVTMCEGRTEPRPEALAMLAREVVAPRALAEDVTAGEEALCCAMLELSAVDRASLLRLSREATP
jgi:hypothetical protein